MYLFIFLSVCLSMSMYLTSFDVSMKMRRCEDEKMRYRPPLLEEPCAQTLSGITKKCINK